jgi:hypothetical protein
MPLVEGEDALVPRFALRRGRFGSTGAAFIFAPWWPYLRTMKSFGKIALVVGLLGGLMAYFIIPLQSTRARAP